MDRAGRIICIRGFLLAQAQHWFRDASHHDLLALVADMQSVGRLSSAHNAALRASLAQSGSGGAKSPFQHPYDWAAFQYYGG
jgi:CHAT domain-containing protein